MKISPAPPSLLEMTAFAVETHEQTPRVVLSVHRQKWTSPGPEPVRRSSCHLGLEVDHMLT